MIKSLALGAAKVTVGLAAVAAVGTAAASPAHASVTHHRPHGCAFLAAHHREAYRICRTDRAHGAHWVARTVSGQRGWSIDGEAGVFLPASGHVLWS